VSLWKRGNIWWSYFYNDGVRHQVSTGTGNRRQAELIEQKLKQEANLARYQVVPVDPHLTFGELAARFIATATPRPNHLDRLKNLLPFFADVPVRQITKGLAERYRQARHGAKTVSDATINRDLSVLRHLLYWAVDESLLPANPLTRLRLARERRFPRPVVSVEEERGILEAAPPHLHGVLLVAFDTGMRRGEILAQRWEHVDLNRHVLFVTKSKTAEGEAREIPLSTRLITLLTTLPRRSDLVFTYHTQGIASPKTAWGSTLKRAGVRHIRFHDIRHTFNTRLMEAGVIQEVRMALMGHATGGSVQSRYTHVELPIKRDAITKLEHWVETQQTVHSQPTGGSDHGPQASGSAAQADLASPADRIPGTYTVEEEDARGSGPGTNGQAARPDRGARGGDEGAASSAPEVRGGSQDL
jgi:integrase